MKSGKLLEPISGEKGLEARFHDQDTQSLDKKKDSLIYIINKNKDLSHEFIQ